jgi:hypothetical protein
MQTFASALKRGILGAGDHCGATCMGLFKKAPTGAERQFRARFSDERPAWMREGNLKATLVEGHQSLEVVGESFYQPSLWRLAGGQRRPEDYVHTAVSALLLVEDDNPYDPAAVSVWIDGLRVGHLSRDDAQRCRPGLLALQDKHGTPIALEGAIIGGGIRDDGPGKLGVFLYYDPEEFGLRRSRVPPPPGARMRTALSDALATDEADDCYDLSWLSDLPADDVRAIPMLRKLLAAEADVLDRHYMYAHLESALYRCRDAFTSALNEYDEACRYHDAEMEGITAACMTKWGKVPLLELYRQMAIRQQKLHAYGRALWWAERGIAIYGDDAARPEAVEDLRQRAASYRVKLGR